MDHQREIRELLFPLINFACFSNYPDMVVAKCYFWGATIVMLLDANEDNHDHFFCFLISNPRTEKFTHILVEHKVFFFAKPENFLFSSLRRCPKMCLWFARLRRENSIEYPARHVCHVLL